MNEMDLFNLAVINRQVFATYGLSYGVLSLVIIIIAYLVRDLPMWFRGVSAALSVWFIFNTFMNILGTQNAFFGLFSQLSLLAASADAPLMKAFMEFNGLKPGDAISPPVWQALGPVAMLVHAALSVYLFVGTDWGREEKSAS